LIRLGVVGHQGYPGLGDVLATLAELAPRLGLEPVLEPELHAAMPIGEVLERPEQVDALLTLGGDGTLLRGSRFLGARSVPILGINLGRLGFLTCCTGDELGLALERFAAGEYQGEQRMALEAIARDADGEERDRWLALNDVVLGKAGIARAVRFRVESNGETIARYSADGVVVCTPTGSTAYSLSAGGPVVYPTLDTLLVTPVSAHTLAIRPLVLPPSFEVTLRTEDASDLLITVDGQRGGDFGPAEVLVVRRAAHQVIIVRLPGQRFFATMRRKLGWGGLAERDESKGC
jgi:NAD+ kinase